MVVEQRRKGDPEGSATPGALLGSTAVRPPDRRGLEALRYCLHNPETGTYVGRTPKHWAQLLLFFSIYYVCLAAFWYAMLNLFFLTVPDNRPKYILEESIIGVNPGVGLVPKQSDDFMDSSIILLKHNAKQGEEENEDEMESNVAWAKRIESFLSRYSNSSGTRSCDDPSEFNSEKESCRFEPATLGECGVFPYGYLVEGGSEEVEPCVFFKLNKIFGWKPKAYDPDSDFEEPKPDYSSSEPEQMEDTRPPSNVQEKVRASPSNVFIDCQGLWPADRETLAGRMQYFPDNQAIPFNFFPYVQTHANYHQPLVAVKFKKLPVGQLIHVECRAWSSGAKHVAKEKSGMVQFEIILQ